MNSRDENAQSGRLLPHHGGYRRLRSFQVAEVIYDGTVIFCRRFIEKRSRTRDQMGQAARSGRQNIAEGSVASATSKKTEIKLTNVAKASLEELLLDYEDYLRQHDLTIWSKDSTQALDVRRTFQEGTERAKEKYDFQVLPAKTFANIMICLIHQATYLLRRQIQRLEEDFLNEGGITERLYRTRVEERAQQQVQTTPACPLCGKPMVKRTARRGPHAGNPFWGCSDYPACRGTRNISDKSDKSDRSDLSDRSDRSDKKP